MLGLFNANISKKEMAKKLSYDSQANCWYGPSPFYCATLSLLTMNCIRDGAGGERWEEGQHVGFRVANFQFLGQVVNIEGCLL